MLLKILTESNPVEVVEYTKSRQLDDQSAFAWWVPYTLQTRDMIIAAVNSHIWKSSHKSGHKITKSVRDAFRIEKENYNTLWTDGPKKEMMNVGIASKILEDYKRTPVGYKKLRGYLIFDVEMDFTWKTRWVKDAHRIADPETLKYTGVVSCESIRVLLTYAALYGVDIMTADIRNAYLQPPTSEKHFLLGRVWT